MNYDGFDDMEDIMTPKRFWLIVCIMLVAIGSMLLAGCGNGGGKGTYTGEKRGLDYLHVVSSQDGKISEFTLNTDHSTNTYGSADIKAPPGAKDGSNFNIGDDGVSSGIGSTYAPMAIDYVKKNQGNLIYIGIGIAVLGLVLAAWPASRVAGFAPVGTGLMIFGVSTCFLPTVIGYAGPWLAGLLVIVAVIAVIVGIAWLVAKRSGKKEVVTAISQRVDNAAAQLNAKGMVDVATAVRRTVNPQYDAAWKAQKTAAAAKVVAANDPLAGMTPTAAVVPIEPNSGTPTSVNTTPTEL